jgi:hypothetical protein
MAVAGCGSDASLNINNNAQCGGGSGPQIRGVVRMPNGRLAARAGLAERLAALAVAPVDALTGTVSPVGRGVTVELVELRPEDVASGEDPGSVGRTTTNANGEFCVGLVRGTTVDVCRYMLRVGDRDDATRTRAFVSASDERIDIDFISEATVQVILNGIPPADLCDFAPDEIGTIRNAVRDVPGSVSGATVAEVNALATTLAIADANVRALLTEAGNLPPATATSVPGAPTATSTRQPSATPVLPTATATLRGPTGSPTSRPTRTPNGPTATVSPTRTTVPTRTNTPGGATVTATLPAATATATRVATTAAVATATVTRTVPAATATATVAGPTPTVTRTVAAATPTATRTAAAATPTFTATTAPAGLGDRVFTIREDSAVAPDPRTGFFSSGLSGFSVAERFTSGPIVITADAPNASGVAQLRLKQDAYFKVFIKLGNTILCVKWVAQNSRGTMDCNGGTAYGVTLTEPANESPPGVPMTGVGSDSGAGAANLFFRQVISEVGNVCPMGGGNCTVTGTPCTTNTECIPASIDDSKACDATTVFDGTGLDVVYTTANFRGMKGTRTFIKNGENFSCSMWTMTDGPGMLVTGLLAVDERAGGTSANGIRVADM